MKFNVDLDIVGDFVRDLREAYERESILKETFSCQTWNEFQMDGGNYADVEFYQVGRRTNFPISIIRDGLYPHNANTIAREMKNGEVRLILQEFNEMARNKKIPSSEISDINTSTFARLCGNVKSPNHLFLPMADQYHELENNWYDNGLINHQQTEEGKDRQMVNIHGNNLELHWLHPELGIRDAYLIYGESIRLIQKQQGDSIPPTEINPTDRYSDVIDKHELMVYFGEDVVVDDEDEDFPEKVEIVYRVVISSPIILADNSVYRLESPSDIGFNEE